MNTQNKCQFGLINILFMNKMWGLESAKSDIMLKFKSLTFILGVH